MFTNIIIGIDGGPGGQDALALARQLAADGARLTLANIWDPRAALASAVTGATHPAPAGRELLEHTRAAADLDCRLAQIGAGSPQRGLQELAEHLEADLIVIGASRHDDPLHLLGDHARGALHGAPCAVAIADTDFAQAPSLHDVAVAWDGSPAASAALAVAKDVAAARRATLHGFSVSAPLPPLYVPEAVVYLDVVEDSAGEELRTRRAELQEAGVTDVRAAKGIPAIQLCDWSADVDLIVAGSRGFGPVRRLFLGSTGDALARNAACSVLVVPRPEPLPGTDPLEHAMLTVI